MSRLNSLKFLLLHKLSKNCSKMSKDIHKEIAYSLDITLNDERFNIIWQVGEKNFKIQVIESDFKFYIKSEFEQISNRNQIVNNENNAEKLVSEIIKKSII